MSVEMTHAQSVARLKEIETELQRMQSRSDLTEHDGRRLDALTVEFGKVNDHRKQLERKSALDVVRGGGTGPFALKTASGSDRGYPTDLAASNGPQDDAMRTLDSHVRSGALHAEGAERVERLLRDGSRTSRGITAQWASATGSEAYLRAFAGLLADPERGHLTWGPDELDAYRRVNAVREEMRAVGIGGSGGYLVPLTLDPTVLITNSGTDAGIRSMARVVQTATGSWSGVTSAGVTATWTAEGVEQSDDSPTFGQPVIPVHKGSAFVPFSLEFEQDAVAATQEIGKLLADAAVNLQSAAYATGTGSGQPKGVVTALAGTASEINSAGTEAVVAADAFALQNALGPRFQANARFGMNLAIKNAFAQLQTENGSTHFPELRQMPPSLLGRGVTEVSDMDGTINAAATASNFVCVYGDWSSFVIVDQIGSAVELIPHLFGANQRPTGQRGMYLHYRSGSDVTVPNGLRLLDVPTTA